MEEFVLTADNYYSKEADMKYMSVHQYLDFVGHMGVHGCEEMAMAKLKGEFEQETTTAMLVGSYVDSYFEGTLEQFKQEHPECFTQKGELKASFKQAEKMIERCEKDSYFMSTMQGEKQVIMTAYLFGCEWKIKMDSYLPGKAIVDLKTSADIHKAWKVQDYGYASFVEYWGYTLQMAVYQKVVEINTGKKLPCYISVVTKEDSPEIAVINIDQMTLDHALNEIEMNMASVLMVKSGEVEPMRCEKCDYCKATKVLKGAISYMDLISE
jgi:hypothetical protein